MVNIMTKIRRIIFKGRGIEAEIAGSGGEGTQPAPNSVGSAEIQDEGVKKEDLEKDIQDKLDVLSDENVISEDELEEGWKEAMRQAGLPIDISDEAGSGSGSASGGGDPEE